MLAHRLLMQSIMGNLIVTVERSCAMFFCGADSRVAALGHMPIKWNAFRKRYNRRKGFAVFRLPGDIRTS